MNSKKIKQSKGTFKDKLNKIAFTVVKPFVKRAARDIVLQNKPVVLEAIKTKVDIPKLDKAGEEKLYTQICDALEEAALAIIDNI